MSSDQSSKRSVEGAGPQSSVAAEALSADFLACSRCSFFFSAYRLLHSDLEKAAAQGQGRSLDLIWNPKSRKLVQESYGARVDIDAYHFEGICPDCYRGFAIEVEDSEKSTGILRIELRKR